MRSMTSPEKYYAEIAEFYDEETKCPIMLAEDIVLFQFLEQEGLLEGAVLDAGCGTGLLLDTTTGPIGRSITILAMTFQRQCFKR